MEIVTKFAPIALALIMFGLGLGLRTEDFLRVFHNPKIFLVICYLISIISLILTGYLMKFSLIFYLFLLFPILHLFIYQIKNLNINNHLQCLKIFKSNNSFGMLIFLNILIGKLI